VAFVTMTYNGQTGSLTFTGVTVNGVAVG